MNLQEFIQQTLIQVAQASHNASQEMQKLGLGAGVQDSTEIDVSFDIAITASEELKNGKKGGLKVISAVMLGAETEDAAKKENISRVKLVLPIKIRAAKTPNVAMV
ncbi:MAG: hypothetical protein ACK5HD_01890 [Bacteroidota bacterium]|jgi:hypothetical protein